MLCIQQLKKEYSGEKILDIKSLAIPQGIVLLQGENGSGKTTFLKIAAGLLDFDGDIIIDDHFSLKKQRQQFVERINYAETEPLYPGFLTAKELVKLFCYAKHGSIAFIEDLLKRLHIYDVYKKPVSIYSAGMIKKLSIALSFAGKPKWILLDEPLITTDKISVNTICTIINEQHVNGTSFLITSHQDFNNNLLAFTHTLLAHGKTITAIK
jgi:ABC-2 type transport system ATP-binding protein